MVKKCVICGIVDHDGQNDQNDICLNCRKINTFNKIRMKSPERIKFVLAKWEKGFVRVRVGVARNAVSQLVKDFP